MEESLEEENIFDATPALMPMSNHSSANSARNDSQGSILQRFKADDMLEMFCIDIIIAVKLRERKHHSQRSRHGELVTDAKDSSRVALAESLANDVDKVLMYAL